MEGMSYRVYNDLTAKNRWLEMVLLGRAQLGQQEDRIVAEAVASALVGGSYQLPPSQRKPGGNFYPVCFLSAFL
jgi:hypothetical protein